MLPDLSNITRFSDMVSSKDKEQLILAQQAIPILRENLRKLARIGEDTTEASQQLDMAEKKIQALLAEL